MSPVETKKRSIELIWIIVKDTDKAIAYYTDVLGFQLVEYNKEYRWAELVGTSGIRLGLGQENLELEMEAGSNAFFTVRVDDLEEEIMDLKANKVKFVGDVIEIPGEVKMITAIDPDGNQFQLVEDLK